MGHLFELLPRPDEVQEMKFTHTADFHVGSSRGIPNYLERQLQAIKEVFAKSKERGIEVVLICGDVAEKDLRLHERDALLDVLLDIDDSGDFKTLIISGNHDQHSHHYSALTFLQVLAKKNRWKNTFVASNSPEIVTVSKQDFLLFPGFYEGKNINRELSKWARKCKVPPVVLMHEVVKGATADNGFKLDHGVRLDPDLRVLYFACGDLHMQQRLSGIKNGFYSGPPCQHDFGEKLPKGFLIVDTKSPTSPEFVEITSVPPLVTVAKPKEAKKTRKDAWVRILSSELVDDEEVDDRVLKVEFVPDKNEETAEETEKRVDVDEIDVIDIKELRRFLRKRSKLSGEHLKVAMRKASEILVKVGGGAR